MGTGRLKLGEQGAMTMSQRDISRISEGFDVMRMFYELTEIVCEQLPEGTSKDRIVQMQQYIREQYDESVWNSDARM